MRTDPTQTAPEANPEGTPPQRLTVNATWRLAVSVTRAVVGLVSVPVYTRLLGMEQWGLIALFQAAAAPLMLLDLGLGAATVKYVSHAVARGDRRDAVRTVHTTAMFTLAMTAVGVLALTLAAPWLARRVFAVPVADQAAATAGFRVAAVAWAASMASAVYAAVLSALQRYDVGSRLATASTVLTPAAGMLAAAATRNVVAVAIAQAVMSLVMAGAVARAAEALLPGSVGVRQWDRTTFRRSFSFGAWQAVAMVGGLLAGWSDRYVLGALFAPVVVGYYAIAVMLYQQMYMAFAEMGEVLFPAVSHREGAGDADGARRIALVVSWTLTSGLGVCAVVLATTGGDFIRLWVSDDAATAATGTLRLLAVAAIVGVAGLAPFHYTRGVGRSHWDAASTMVMGVVVTAVTVWLAPGLGLPGVGIAAIAGLSTRWIFVAAMWRAHFAPTVSLREFALHVWVPALTSIGLLLGAIRLHDAFRHAPDWIGFALESAVVLVSATGAQLLLSEVMPGGAARRRHVYWSFRPLLPGLRRPAVK